MLLALRVDKLISEPPEDAVVARDGAFLLNNLLLVTFTFTVLIGTLFPIIAEAVRGVKVSVGEPYFNRMAVPICSGLLLLMGIGPALPWGRSDRSSLRRALLVPIPAALVGFGLAFLLGARHPSILLTAALAGYTLWVTADQALRPARARARKGESLPAAVEQSFRRSPRRIGGYVVHLGVIVTFVAIAISATYQLDLEATLAPGEHATVGAYQLTFEGARLVEEPHLTAQQATVTVERPNRKPVTLEPALNFYRTQREPIGTPAVKTTLTHDLYLTLMNVGEDGRVGLRVIVTPAVVWIWIGVVVMVIGTTLCLLPGRPIRTSGRAQPAESVAG